MESSALQAAESVCVKGEPCEDVCITGTGEPTFEGVSVKAEPLLDEVCIKDEPGRESVSIKAESSCSYVRVKNESHGVSAAAALYADHAVKDELVLGPELVERRGVRRAPTVSASNLAIKVKQSCGNVAGRTFQMDGCVKLEPLVVDTLLTGTRSTDQDCLRQVQETGIECENKNSAVGNFEIYNRGQGPQKMPVSTPEHTTARKTALTHPENKHKCDYCSYASNYRGSLIIHIRKHTGEKPYKCGQCSYACSRGRSLKQHMGKHTAELPYKCDYGSYASNRSDHLLIHKRKHTGEKPYKCGQCSYACSTNRSLKQHMGKHTALPYKCDYCSYASNHRGSMIIHKREHTGEMPYKCGQCSYACTTGGSLKQHTWKHAAELPYKCDYCSYAHGLC